jgi:outer membrane protein insertion porin family
VTPPDRVPDTWGSGSLGAAAPEAKPAPAEDLTAPRESPLPVEGSAQAVEAPREAGRRGRSKTSQSIRYTLENIEVRGNVRSRARVVLRYLPFKPGDIIDVDDPEVELTRYRLLGTGFFRDVQFSLRKGSQRGNVVLIVEVVERNTIIVNNLWMGLSVDAAKRLARPRMPGSIWLRLTSQGLGSPWAVRSVWRPNS